MNCIDINRENNINHHYRSCSELRRLALRMRRTIGSVEDISVNASIVASQTGNKARVFFEISSQIEKTSRKMHAKINMIIHVTSKLIETVLASKIAQYHIDSYMLVQIPEHNTANYELVKTVTKRLQKDVALGLVQFRNEIKALEVQFNAFDFLINRIFVALTALRIEEELFRAQLEMVAVGSLIKSFEELLNVLSEDYDVFRDYFMIFKHSNKLVWNSEE